MEPCLFRHGKEELIPSGEEGLLDASMEPCLFRHGKGASPIKALPLITCFNGAMSFQTW